MKSNFIVQYLSNKIILILYVKQFIFIIMDSAHPTVSVKFFTLKQTAEILAVTVDTLLEWNDNNILKPTITLNGEVGYTQEQISKFLAIQEQLQNIKIDYEKAEISQQSQL